MHQHLRLPVAHAPETTPLLLHKAWEHALPVHHDQVTTPSLPHKVWEPAPQVHLPPEVFLARWLLAQVACHVPVEPVAQVVPVVQVAVAQVQVLDSSAQVVVADSVRVLLVEPQVVLVHQLVQVLALTVHQQVAVVAVAPAVEPLVRSVVAVESPKHVSRRERKEQSLNSARHHRLVA